MKKEKAPDYPKGPLPVAGLVRGEIGIGRQGSDPAQVEFQVGALVEVVWPIDGIAWTKGCIGTITRVEVCAPWVYYRVAIQKGANTWYHSAHGNCLRHLLRLVPVAGAALEPGRYEQAPLF